MMHREATFYRILHPSIWLGVCVLCWMLFVDLSRSEASDKRLALLIGHQRGWTGEQMLPWVLSGDLQPVAQILRSKLGFKVIVLKNQRAHSVRSWFRKVRVYVRKHKISTFLFYYSGHADKRYFHLGRRRRRPLGYKEFLRFFMRLPVKRRFAILDACHGGSVIPILRRKMRRMRKGGAKQARLHHSVLREINRSLPSSSAFRNLQELRRWYRGAMAKGVRRPKRKVNFNKLPILQREDGAGTHIIGTVGVAWHEPRWRSSLLTYQLLRGLRGEADTVKDGRITIGELYNFVQAEARKHGQALSRFVLFNGNYTFAPNYRSHLRIDKHIVGTLRLRIAQFYWSYQKTRRRGVEIPTVSGKGIVEIRHAGRCWRQSIKVTKGEKIRLQRYGHLIRCSHPNALQKGAIRLPGTLHWLAPSPSTHSFSVSMGFSELGALRLHTRGLWSTVGYRWSRMFGASIQYEWGESALNWSLHRVSLQLEAGYPISIKPIQLFVGGYARLGTLVSKGSSPEDALYASWSWGAGGLIEVDWAFDRFWGLRVGSQIGLDWTHQVRGSSLSLRWGFLIALVFTPL